jgi:hypothetical protein
VTASVLPTDPAAGWTPAADCPAADRNLVAASARGKQQAVDTKPVTASAPPTDPAADWTQTVDRPAADPKLAAASAAGKRKKREMRLAEQVPPTDLTADRTPTDD